MARALARGTLWLLAASICMIAAFAGAPLDTRHGAHGFRPASSASAAAQEPAGQRPDRVLLRLTPDASIADLRARFVQAFASGGCPFDGAAWRAACAPVLDRLNEPSGTVLRLPEGVTVARALAWLQQQPQVVLAEPDYLAATEAAPNDPLYATDQQYLASINAPAAWDLQTGNAGVVIAVLDSGVDVTHPDLVRNIWTNPQPGAGDCGQDLHGCNFVDPALVAACAAPAPVRTPDVSPTRWHGTFVAGVIGAAGNNGTGVTGVAWNVSLMPVRVADCRGQADTIALVDGIHYAVDHGARIIDIGVGSSRATATACRAPSRFVADAVQYARDHSVLVIAPAGNDNKGCVADPAAAPGVLAVGGLQTPAQTRWSPSRTEGSNWGAEIAVAAPAAGITSTVPRRAGPPPNDLYAGSAGTSFAAPIVAGEAALLLSSNALLTPDWLLALITLGAQPRPDGNAPGWAGAGSIDLAASLRLVPAAYSGALLVGGAPAPDGTLVEGYVGGRLCAQTASFSNAAGSSYALIVPTAAMQQGCGVRGATVEIRAGGLVAASLPWAAAGFALDLDAPAGDASSAPPSAAGSN